MRATAMNPRRLLPHPRPSFAYIAGAASGKTAPNKLLHAVRAATALAACDGKASIRYVWMGRKIPIMPKPNGTRPITGTSQYTALSVVHPYQKKVIGTKQANTMQAGRRISGSGTPPFAFVMRITVASESFAVAIRPMAKPMPRLMNIRPQRSGAQW